MAHILLVDDDDLLIELVQFTLEDRGYEVTLANDGETALSLVQEQKFDLIVLDGMMPGMDGIDVLKALQNLDVTKNVPVVMLSARRMENDIVGGLSNGAEDYLVKPFMPEELVTRIDKILQRPAA